LDDCKRALEIDSSNAEAWIRCGFAYEMQGTSDKALEAYQKAVELDPAYYKPYQYLGGFYYYQGKFAEAEQQFRKEVEHAQNDLDGYSDLGGALTEQGKYAEAETAYKTASQIKTTGPSLNNLGGTLAYLGRDAAALSLYKQAAALEPANLIYRINIADSARRLGLTGEAKAAYRKAFILVSNQLQINAASGEARAYKAYTEARLGKKDDAMDEIGQALQFSSNDKEVTRRAVLTYEALGERDLALKVAAQAPPEIRKAIKVHPDLADLRRDLRYIQVTGNSK
jgi:Flp pilus assembly protein TadD